MPKDKDLDENKDFEESKSDDEIDIRLNTELKDKMRRGLIVEAQVLMKKGATFDVREVKSLPDFLAESMLLCLKECDDYNKYLAFANLLYYKLQKQPITYEKSEKVIHGIAKKQEHDPEEYDKHFNFEEEVIALMYLSRKMLAAKLEFMPSVSMPKKGKLTDGYGVASEQKFKDAIDKHFKHVLSGMQIFQNNLESGPLNKYVLELAKCYLNEARQYHLMRKNKNPSDTQLFFDAIKLVNAEFAVEILKYAGYQPGYCYEAIRAYRGFFGKPDLKYIESIFEVGMNSIASLTEKIKEKIIVKNTNFLFNYSTRYTGAERSPHPSRFQCTGAFTYLSTDYKHAKGYSSSTDTDRWSKGNVEMLLSLTLPRGSLQFNGVNQHENEIIVPHIEPEMISCLTVFNGEGESTYYYRNETGKLEFSKQKPAHEVSSNEMAGSPTEEKYKIRELNYEFSNKRSFVPPDELDQYEASLSKAHHYSPRRQQIEIYKNEAAITIQKAWRAYMKNKQEHQNQPSESADKEAPRKIKPK